MSVPKPNFRQFMDYYLPKLQEEFREQYPELNAMEVYQKAYCRVCVMWCEMIPKSKFVVE